MSRVFASRFDGGDLLFYVSSMEYSKFLCNIISSVVLGRASKSRRMQAFPNSFFSTPFLGSVLLTLLIYYIRISHTGQSRHTLSSCSLVAGTLPLCGITPHNYIYIFSPIVLLLSLCSQSSSYGGQYNHGYQNCPR